MFSRHIFYAHIFPEAFSAALFSLGTVAGKAICLWWHVCLWFDIKNQVHSYIIKIKVFIQFMIFLIGCSVFPNTYSMYRNVNHKYNVRAAKHDTSTQNQRNFVHFTVLPRNSCNQSDCQIDAQSLEGRTLSPIPLQDSYWWNHPSSSWNLKKDQKREIFRFLMQVL